jgi:hypothetical protein
MFFDQDFGCEEGTNIVGALVGNANFDGLDTLVAFRRIEVQAVPARVQIGPAVPAPLCHLDLIRNLNFRGAVIAASYQMESRFDASSGTLGTRRWFRFPLAVIILIAVLAILSAHYPP